MLRLILRKGDSTYGLWRYLRFQCCSDTFKKSKVSFCFCSCSCLFVHTGVFSIVTGQLCRARCSLVVVYLKTLSYTNLPHAAPLCTPNLINISCRCLSQKSFCPLAKRRF